MTWHQNALAAIAEINAACAATPEAPLTQADVEHLEQAIRNLQQAIGQIHEAVMWEEQP